MVSRINHFNGQASSELEQDIEVNKRSTKEQSDPQVKAGSRLRRKLSNAYKLEILTAYDACSNGLERGALLRREGLYHSRIASWRNKFSANNDGRKSSTKMSRSDHLVREVEQLKKKLSQAQAVIELQKKVSELLGTHILSHEYNEGNL